MAYQINKTNGTIIATVADGQVDQLSTDITLIGKNYSSYGDALNENFIKILENFADTKRPQNPITGQLWFDTTETSLKIYSGTSFVPVSSTAIADRQPASLRVGDLWFDNINKQLNFYDGKNLVLVSPAYTAGQGKSGFEVESILDTLNQTRIITSLYTGGILLGIFSKDAFTPRVPIVGFSGTIVPGFNSADIAGIKFDVTCTNAEQLNGIDASQYLRTDTGLFTTPITVASDGGITIGNPGNATMLIDNGNLTLSNLITGRDMHFQVNPGVLETAMSVYTNSRTICLYEDHLTSYVKVGGSLEIGGNLTVSGDITTVSSSEVVITDKNITLARLTDEEGQTLPSTDEYANGGGITIAGLTDHTLVWSTDPVPQWTSSENFNLAQGKYYAINNFPLIQAIDPSDPNSKFKLTDHITEIDGISVFGKREKLSVGPYPVGDQALLEVENSTITTFENHDLELAPDGNIVLTTSPIIQGLADPVDVQDAATKNYVDEQNKAQTIFLSTTMSDPNELIEADFYNLLNTMIPTGSVTVGTLVTLLCTIVSNTGSVVSTSVNTSTEKFCISDGFGAPSGSDASAITAVGVNDITVPAQEVSVSRIIKTFRYEGTGWNHLTDVAWSPS